MDSVCWARAICFFFFFFFFCLLFQVLEVMKCVNSNSRSANFYLPKTWVLQKTTLAPPSSWSPAPSRLWHCVSSPLTTITTITTASNITVPPMSLLLSPHGRRDPCYASESPTRRRLTAFDCSPCPTDAFKLCNWLFCTVQHTPPKLWSSIHTVSWVNS